jgi:CRISPR-associated exonuclease Cas4
MDSPQPPIEANDFSESDWHDPNEDDITITLIKQHAYCARIAYYETCTPDVRPRTYKMDAGEAAHERERQRAARRSLAAYQIPEGERRFEVRMRSESLQLVGKVDEIILAPDRVIVVDYKLTSWVWDNHELQITAYAMLAEETFGLPAPLGYIYLLKRRKFHPIPVTDELRQAVLATIQSLNRIRFDEYMPPPAAKRNKCIACEFRRFCNDV